MLLISRTLASLIQDAIVLRLDGCLREAAINVKRYALVIIISQPRAEDNPTDDEHEREFTPARLLEKLAPTVQAIEHGNGESDVERVRVRLSEGEGEAHVEQSDRGERQILDRAPIFLRVLLPEPEDD